MGPAADDGAMGLNEDRLPEDEAAGLPARRFAFSLVSRVLDQRVTLDEASQALAKVSERMEQRDSAFGRAIAYAALRHKGSLEVLLARFVEKPLPAHGLAATRVLLCGAAELMILEGKAHAAVDGANRLAVATREAKPFKPLINAVLRRLAREGGEIYAALDRGSWDTPDWLWQRWVAAYGLEAAKGIATAHGSPAPLDLTIREPHLRAYWREMLEGQSVGAGTLRLGKTALVEALAGFDEGAWWVQDAAAAIPAQVLLSLIGEAAGKTLIDLCAAPGGKTMQLAASGAEVIAVDTSSPRLRRVTDNLGRTQLKARLVAADARTWRPEQPVDGILLDAPCSATGTIRRHPELPWIRDAGSITRNAAVAADLMDAAWEMLSQGGVLTFAVCSLEPEEGEAQIAAFRARHEDAAVEPLAAEAFSLPVEARVEDGLRILPSMMAAQGGMDGFFVAALRKASGVAAPFSEG